MAFTDTLRRREAGRGAAAPRAAAAFIPSVELGPRLRIAGRGLLLPVLLGLAWEGTARSGLVPSHLLPAPSVVAAELRDLAVTGELGQHILVTVGRVGLGFFWGAVAATIFGALTGTSRQARELLDPSFQALKAVPSLAWVPLFILWFGIFEASKITLIAVGVFFPIYLNLMSAIRDTDRKLVEVARIYRLSTANLLRRVLLPSTLPSFIVGLRSGLALGWMFVIAAELMGASEGLGFLMIDGQMTGRPAVIIGALLLFAVAGKASDALLAAATRPLVAWQDSYGGMGREGGHA